MSKKRKMPPTTSDQQQQHQQRRPKRPRVVYLRDDAATRYEFSVQSPQHPMKPWRLMAVHAVVRRLGLFPNNQSSVLRVLTPPPLPADLLQDFHLAQYVDDLEKASGDCWRYIPADSMPSSNEWIPLHQRPQVQFGEEPPTTTTTAIGSSTTTTSAQQKGNVPENNNQISSATSSINNNPQSTGSNHNNIHHTHQEQAPSCYSAFDCPPVQGGLEYSQKVAASSLFGAVLLNAGAADTVINWNGGMHHARAGTCSGFCYVNDCVIAIRELLRAHDRVLYIDLDVHHGDGVEEAFYDTERVFTLSLHKFADGFFPGTGHAADVGVDRGRYFSMNIPLRDGIRDSEYLELFTTAFSGIMRAFRPSVAVLQCGADSLAGDRLGGTCLRLSSAGHAACVRAVRDSGIKILALGGGGYAVRNVARLWAFETAVLCGCDEEDGFWNDDDDDENEDHEDAAAASTNHQKTQYPKITSRSLFSLPNAASVLNYFSFVKQDSAEKEKQMKQIEQNDHKEDDEVPVTDEKQNGDNSNDDDDDDDCRNVLRKIVTCSDSEELQVKLEERALLLIFPESATMENNNNSHHHHNQKHDDLLHHQGGRGEPDRTNHVSLYVSCDDGGYEVRQSYAATMSGGGGAVLIQRYMQTTLKRINEHLNYLRQQMKW